jgi:plastocyanin
LRSGTNFAITINIMAIIASGMLLVILGPLSVEPGHGEQIRSVKTLEPTTTVVIENSTFNPTYLTVLAGTNVTWKNPSEHAQSNSVVSDDLANGTRVFDSGPLNAGESFSFTFNEVGNYTSHSGRQYYTNASVNVIPNAPESFFTPGPVTPEGYPTAAIAPPAMLRTEA